MASNGVNVRLFLHRLSAGPMNIAYIHGKVYAIDGYLPMRWVEYDHEEVSISMNKYFIHECGRFMGTMQHIVGMTSLPLVFSFARIVSLVVFAVKQLKRGVSRGDGGRE